MRGGRLLAGSPAMDAADILPGFRGRAVHDFWRPYLQYDCDHAFCHAHLLRELVFLWEEQHQGWAKTRLDQRLTIHVAVETARDAGLAALRAEDLDRFHVDYLRIVDAGYAENPVPVPAVSGPTRRGRRGQSKARNLLDRFRDHPDGILAFMRDFAVPFTNNWSTAPRSRA
jgi:transposase